MNLDFMLAKFEEKKDGTALVWKGKKYLYGFFMERTTDSKTLRTSASSQPMSKASSKAS